MQMLQQIEQINQVNLQFKTFIEDHNILDKLIQEKEEQAKYNQKKSLKKKTEIEEILSKNQSEINYLKEKKNNAIKLKNTLVPIYQKCDQKYPIEFQDFVEIDEDDIV